MRALDGENCESAIVKVWEWLIIDGVSKWFRYIGFDFGRSSR